MRPTNRCQFSDHTCYQLFRKSASTTFPRKPNDLNLRFSTFKQVGDLTLYSTIHENGRGKVSG
eukprot:m.77839 g.77839  ORF g.77839 m.77839 type:complete len:63 (-) comp20706_c0_seq2:365-553(-)